MLSNLPEDKQLKFLMQSQGLNPSSLASTYIFSVLPYDNTVQVCPWSLNDAMAPGKKVDLRGTELTAKGLRSLDSQGTAFCHVMGGNLLSLTSVPVPHLADTSALGDLFSLLIMPSGNQRFFYQESIKSPSFKGCLSLYK